MRNVLDSTQRLRLSFENHVRNELLSNVSNPSSAVSQKRCTKLLLSCLFLPVLLLFHVNSLKTTHHFFKGSVLILIINLWNALADFFLNKCLKLKVWYVALLCCSDPGRILLRLLHNLDCQWLDVSSGFSAWGHMTGIIILSVLWLFRVKFTWRCDWTSWSQRTDPSVSTYWSGEWPAPSTFIITTLARDLLCGLEHTLYKTKHTGIMGKTKLLRPIIECLQVFTV